MKSKCSMYTIVNERNQQIAPPPPPPPQKQKQLTQLLDLRSAGKNTRRVFIQAAFSTLPHQGSRIDQVKISAKVIRISPEPSKIGINKNRTPDLLPTPQS